MNMHGIDWAIVAIFLIGLMGLGLYTRRYVRGVSDFLSASRCADRFMLTVASGAAGVGTISMVAVSEQIYAGGFAQGWWGNLYIPIGLLITLSGFVIYRFRETRAMTLAQFFELRYSKRFRIFAGILIFLSGTINYGIFPAVSARFFVHFCGFPPEVHWAGYTLSTFAVIMAVLLAGCLFFTLLGGQITIMITDFVQGQIMNIVFLVLLIFLLLAFPWSRISGALLVAPPEQSMVHPFHTSGVKDFNLWYYLIGIVGAIYGVMAWQGNSGYNSSASTPHEAKMGGVLAGWRGMTTGMLLCMMPICAYTYMHHPAYARQAAVVTQKLAAIENAQIRTQMTVPTVLADFLPQGMMGLLCMVMVSAFFTCDNTYLHSWGTIFIQDVILPFRRKPFTPRQHLWLLRGAIFGVSVFAFFFSLFFRQTDYVLMFFALTGAIWLGGAGAVILGGLYWKRGTTAAAWAALITGSSLAFGSILLQQLWERGFMPNILQRLWGICPILNDHWALTNVLKNLPTKCPINGQWGLLISMVSAIGMYVIISLVQWREFDLNAMLHRTPTEKDTPADHSRSWWFTILDRLGLVGAEFTRMDKIIYIATTAWSLFWFLVFVGVSIYNKFVDVKPEWWVKFFHVQAVYVPLGVSLIVTPVFLIFGTRDAIRMFRRLATIKRNDRDDGTVVEHRNLDDLETGKAPSPERKIA